MERGVLALQAPADATSESGPPRYDTRRYQVCDAPYHNHGILLRYAPLLTLNSEMSKWLNCVMEEKRPAQHLGIADGHFGEMAMRGVCLKPRAAEH